MTLDEEVDLGLGSTYALSPQKGDSNPHNYRIIAELYQRLKRNYDDRRDRKQRQEIDDLFPPSSCSNRADTGRRGATPVRAISKSLAQAGVGQGSIQL